MIRQTEDNKGKPIYILDIKSDDNHQRKRFYY